MAEFGKLNFAVAFNPQTAFPLDARYYFSSKADADAAAATAVEVGSSTGTYFYGQNLVVVADNKATLYVIQPDKTLKEVGSSPVGDGRSIEVGTDGTVKMVGMPASTETSIKIPYFDPTTKKLAWRDDTSASSATVTALTGRIDDAEEKITELESNINKVFTYSGKVYLKEEKYYSDSACTKELTTAIMAADENYIGNVYSLVRLEKVNNTYVENTSANEEIVWDGSQWINLGSIFNAQPILDRVDNLEAIVGDTNEGLVKTVKDQGDAITDLTTTVNGINGNYLPKATYNTLISGMENKPITEYVADEIGNIGSSETVADYVDTKYNTLEESVESIGSDLANHTHNYVPLNDAEYKNTIDTIQIDGASLTPANKVINIPRATTTKLGVVKNWTKDTAVNGGVNTTNANKVFVIEEGTDKGKMQLASVNVNILVQTEGEELTLDAGNATAR